MGEVYPQDNGHIRIIGARQHNLKNITLSIPRHKLVVITGPSGSGKSSLAFDTLFAEGQRRYVQSLSSYARQFLDQMEKPDVDFIEGLSPSVAIEQHSAGGSPRSIIATSTEIYDYLRLLFASCGQRYHPETGKLLQKFTTQQIADRILAEKDGSAFVLLAPIVKKQKGDMRDVFERLRKDGYVRVRVDGEIRMLEETTKLDKNSAHDVEVVIDRLKVDSSIRTRLADSLELALKVGKGVVIVHWPGKKDWLLSNQAFDPETGYRFPELTARHFSFNSPLGACPECHGLGTQLVIDPDLLVPDKTRSLAEEAIAPWSRGVKSLAGHYQGILRDLARHAGVSMNTAWNKLPEKFKKLVLEGSRDKFIEFTVIRRGEIRTQEKKFEGVIAQVREMHDESYSIVTRMRLRQYMNRQTCAVCHGSRLRPEVLCVKLQSESQLLNIHEFCRLNVVDAFEFLEKIQLNEEQQKISKDVLREIHVRLQFMRDVGLEYLTLDRETGTLSGGEAQRIRLATQIGSGLTGVLYVLDEPSIGLHARDQDRLLRTLCHLRDLGNTVIVVEHDEATIRHADHIVDLGPAAGARGGYVVAEGSVQDILKNPKSPTGLFLSGKMKIGMCRDRLATTSEWLTVRGAKENNLKNIDAKFPLHLMTCVTGVSGSGKSTLVNDILCRALERHFYNAKDKPGKHRAFDGLDYLDKIVVVDQSPIGRTPRSNALTYTGAFNYIRDLFARLPAARVRGYTKSRFSFNTTGGRCEHCEGEGYIKIEMNFLPDVYVKCSVCNGDRFNRETLEITYKGYTIADILRLTVNECLGLFKNIPGLSTKLEALCKVGLGYLPGGQAATSLSGGEAQRIKLATELSKRATGRTLFVLDEPTTGLHASDIDCLLKVLCELRDAGNTIVIIEHQLDVIKSCDWIIDLGPEGGEGGGNIVVAGTPEEVVKCSSSHTGRFLARVVNSKKS